MKRCKLFILCCLMIIAAVGNGNADEPKQKPQEWQIKGALAALDDAIPQVQAIFVDFLSFYEQIP